MNIFQATINKKAIRPTLVIINGESNSGGVAPNGQALASELLPRPNTLIFNNTSLTSFDILDIGTNNLVDHAGLTNGATHGFELELANRVDTNPFYTQPTYLIKTGQGGSQISGWNVGGGFYTKFLQRINGAKTLIDFDECNKVILYSLGINDAIAGANVNTWKIAVQAHFVNMRNEIGANTPIIMTEFQGMGGGNYTAFTNMVQTIASEDPNVYSVSGVGAGLQDTNHWNYAGIKVMASRMLNIFEGL